MVLSETMLESIVNHNYVTCILYGTNLMLS